MKPHSLPIMQLSPHLFWDMEAWKLDSNNNRAFIISRVLEYGLWQDWLLIHKFYGLETIAGEAMLFREMDPKALAFISHVAGVPKENFRCYTTRQSIPPHWNF